VSPQFRKAPLHVPLHAHFGPISRASACASGSVAIQLSIGTSAESPSQQTAPLRPHRSVAHRREGSSSTSLAGPALQLGCPEVEVELIKNKITGLHDVLVSFNETSIPCRRCILSTVASVCGDLCAREHLHLMLDEPINSTVCVLPELANILFAAQASVLENAVHSHEPVGLSIASPGSSETDPTATLLMHDLFLPTDETVHGQPVLRGIDTNHSIFVCNLCVQPNRTHGYVGHHIIWRA
jgi:hypothetical protein